MGPGDDRGYESDYDYDSDAERRAAIEARIASQQREDDSIGMGPGRTGVKGVIRDRKEAASLARTKRAQDVESMNRAMEKASLGGLTWAEEEKLRLAEKAREPGILISHLVVVRSDPIISRVYGRVNAR